MSTRAASVAHGNPLDLATDDIIEPRAPPVPQGCELQDQPLLGTPLLHRRDRGSGQGSSREKNIRGESA